MEENAWGKMKKANAGNIDDCDRNKTFFFSFSFDPAAHGRT